MTKEEIYAKLDEDFKGSEVYFRVYTNKNTAMMDDHFTAKQLRAIADALDKFESLRTK